jgi:cytochrome c2
MRLLRIMLLASLLPSVLMVSGCGENKPPAFEPLTGGDPQLGKPLLNRYGCTSCHTVEGIAHADANVGPPLTGIRDRSYIAGVAQNNADNLVRWITHPHSLSPNTAMPELGVSEKDARDIAAYLYSQ